MFNQNNNSAVQYVFTRSSLTERVEDTSITVEQIAQDLEVKVSTINYYMKKWGLKKATSSGGTDIPKEQIETHWNDPEKSIKAIANELEISRSMVMTAAKFHDLGPKAKIILGFDDTVEAGKEVI